MGRLKEILESKSGGIKEELEEINELDSEDLAYLFNVREDDIKFYSGSQSFKVEGLDDFNFVGTRNPTTILNTLGFYLEESKDTEDEKYALFVGEDFPQ